MRFYDVYIKQFVLFSPELAVWPQQRVDPVDDPAEETAVQGFAHGVPHLHCLFHRVGPNDRLSPGHDAVGGQGFLELVRANTQQRRHWGNVSYDIGYKLALLKWSDREQYM